jgi:hypothetical protein
MMKSLTLALVAGIAASTLAASTLAFAQGAAPAAPPAAAKAPGPSDKAPKSAACTVAKAMSCKADATCAPTTEIGEIKLPMKITLDFQNHVMLSVDNDGFPVATAIDTLAGGNQEVILQGIDRGVGWVMHGSANDLKVSFAMTSHETVLAAFGTCDVEFAE